MTFTRWLALMERLQLPPARATYDALMQAYTAPDRHYHNDQHIARCLAELDAAAPHIADPGPIELALWFHDAVYDSHSASNEADSAQWAADFLQSVQSNQALTETVTALILATRHQPGELSPDEAWIVDIDLSSLGTSPAQFDADNQAIRPEYAWVPLAVYREKRVAILQGFLDRPLLYATSFFQQKYEAQARINLAWACQLLKG